MTSVRFAFFSALALTFACGGPLPTAPATPGATSASNAGDAAVLGPAPVDPPALVARKPEPFVVPAIPSVPSANDDRSETDRALDAGRHPAEMLAFFGIAPGQHVAELGAGSGYTTELLARAVGDTGVVYGQNPKWLLEKFAEKPWSARLEKPVMKHVIRLDREFDDPFPPEVKNLDAIVSILFYHDTVWLSVDRDKMNRAAFAALKSGGIYGIIDHSARAGAGLNAVKTFHRIEESTLKNEVLKAGFKLAGEADFLRNPGDTRDWNDSPSVAADRRGTSDRFVLKFVKP
jgi:predicted methyltransferase